MQFSFLMCSERSGSNLLTSMINAHSRYCGPSPVHIIRHTLENIQRYGNLDDNDNWQRILGDIRELFQTKTGVWKSQWPAYDGKAGDLAGLIRRIYENEARKNHKERLFVKENHLYKYLPFITAFFPQSKIVYLVRDPRDMALSWKKSPVLRGAVIRGADIWHMDQHQGVRIYNWLRATGSIYLLKYENLVANSERELRSLCNFLEIEFEYGMLDFSKTKLTTENARRTEVWNNLQKPVMKKNFNKYKKELSADEIAYVEAVCAEEMFMLGYPLENQGQLNADKLREKIKPLERYEKEEYYLLPESERTIRRRRERVVQKMSSRSPKPIFHRQSFNGVQIPRFLT